MNSVVAVSCGMSAFEFDKIAAEFCQRTLPKQCWTHEAHLRVGLWHLLNFDPDEALGLLRERITAFNEASGVENTESSGYHETITRFYVWRIGEFVRQADPTRPFDDLASELIAQCGDRDLPLRYYSKELLMSTAARRSWVEPDLRPLGGL